MVPAFGGMLNHKKLPTQEKKSTKILGAFFIFLFSRSRIKKCLIWMGNRLKWHKSGGCVLTNLGMWEIELLVDKKVFMEVSPLRFGSCPFSTMFLSILNEMRAG